MLEKEFWVADDEAYACDESLLAPYLASILQGFPYRDAYNFFQSSLRMQVEQAFGYLVNKWRILRQMDFSLEVSIEIIIVTMKLHNFCINQNGRQHRINWYSSQYIATLREESDGWYRIAKEENWQIVTMLRESSEADFERGASKRREKMVAPLEGRGILRP